MSLVLCLAVFLLSCASHYASDGEQRYKKSKNGSGIVVLPPLTDTNMSHFYDLPDQNQNADVSISPPA